MSDYHVASLFAAMLDIPSESATTYEPLCGVVPGVLQQAFCQVATDTKYTINIIEAALKSKVQKLQVNGVHVMQGVTYTKRDAQEAMQKLLQGNVVLVGHALHHDLHALHLDPIAVIDTALLCSYKYANLVQRCVQCVMLRPCSSALPALPVIPFSCLSTCATTQQTHPVQNRYCQAAILHTNCSI